MKILMIMNKYRLATILVAVLIAGSTAKAQTTTIGGSVYGGGALADTGDTHVNLIGGTINGDVYGGGKGDATTEAKVGSTQVNLNGMSAAEYKEDYSTWGLVKGGEDDAPYTVANTGVKGCVVGGSIFGCNNINGTPQGDATVHVYKTQNAGATQIGNTETMTTAKQNGAYDLTAVYGGGNLAPFVPTADNASTHVIIDGCDLTSIETVYGGGNAASTPTTDVTVNGTFEIKELFGGGNGLNALPDGKPNPGANVGYKNYTEYVEDGGTLVARDKEEANTKEKRLASDYVYGTGAANVTIYGGTIHQVFGGSNTKGNVRISAVTLLDDNNDCDFKIDEAYGGGKSAPMDAEAKLLMSCIPGLKAAYGGAEAADILGDVTLNITNGTFDRVFGGNNISGRIGGTITVNIEETGCKPVIIGQLYGGGNQAAYKGPLKAGSETDRQGPTVNVRSFTSIGDVYGGGYGKTAVVTGNTTVNINVCKGDFSTPDESMANYINDAIGNGSRTITFTEYKRTEDGGFETDDAGNRLSEEKAVVVTLPTHENDKIGAINNVYGGGNAARVDGDTYVNVGTQTGETVTLVSKDGENVKILGADIRGNVYGGGNQADVTGDTHVQIGKKVEP